MARYRRAYQPGGTFFFTIVTNNRRKIFHNPQARNLLHEAIRKVQAERPFEVPAIVVLPEHLHCIWKLPVEDADFSVRWSCIKRNFTKSWLRAGGTEGSVRPYRAKLRERGVWQRRFWEHRIRSEDDFIKHVNYIHYNPVKHNLAACPHLWPYSSFHRWAKEDHYAADWLCRCDKGKLEPPDFGDIENTIRE